jgi:hypothetical protein
VVIDQECRLIFFILWCGCGQIDFWAVEWFGRLAGESFSLRDKMHLFSGPYGVESKEENRNAIINFRCFYPIPSSGS